MPKSNHFTSSTFLPGKVALAQKGPLYIPGGVSYGASDDLWHLFFEHCGIETTDLPGAHTLNDTVLSDLFLSAADRPDWGFDHAWLYGDGLLWKVALVSRSGNKHQHDSFFTVFGFIDSKYFYLDGHFSNYHGPAVTRYDERGVMLYDEFWIDGKDVTAEDFPMLSRLAIQRSQLHLDLSQITAAAGSVNV